MNNADKSWLFTILIMSGSQAYGAVAPVVKGEIPNAKEVRRAYALSAVFVLALAIVFSVAMESPEPIIAALPIILANIAVQEWAIAIANVETERRPKPQEDHGEEG